MKKDNIIANLEKSFEQFITEIKKHYSEEPCTLMAEDEKKFFEKISKPETKLDAKQCEELIDQEVENIKTNLDLLLNNIHTQLKALEQQNIFSELTIEFNSQAESIVESIDEFLKVKFKYYSESSAKEYDKRKLFNEFQGELEKSYSIKKNFFELADEIKKDLIDKVRENA